MQVLYLSEKNSVINQYAKKTPPGTKYTERPSYIFIEQTEHIYTEHFRETYECALSFLNQIAGRPYIHVILVDPPELTVVHVIYACHNVRTVHHQHTQEENL